MTESKGFWQGLITKTVEEFNAFLPRLIYAAIFLVIGIFVIRLLMSFLKRIMIKAKTELSVRSFIESMSIAICYALLAYVVGRTLGIQALNFTAIFTGATVTIGLALQGSLSNFAGGLLILFFKPFKIGDEVQIGDVEGEVSDINILYTKVHNWRGEYYTLPNGKVSNEVVKNNSSDEYRRVQIELHFSHDEDFDRLREIVTETMKQHPEVALDRPFQLWISNFQDYYIKASARCWCKTSQYWGVYWAQEEAIKKALQKHGIKLQIPRQIVDQPDLKVESLDEGNKQKN